VPSHHGASTYPRSSKEAPGARRNGDVITSIAQLAVIDPEKGQFMKVVLFCGGFGTRIREFSESLPKPMIPVGHQPILWHVMQYYRDYGHSDFVLTLGYKANIIKEFFLAYRSPVFADCVVSGSGANVELLNEPDEDWRVTLIDTGLWRNIGERLWAVRDYVKNEEIFLANYSDGLTNVDLNDMVERFKQSGKVACFLAVRPPLTFHLADIGDDGRVRELRPAARSEMWINGGYFVLRREIFDYMVEGEELVVEPFRRLIEADQLLAYKHDDFFRSMDTLKDWQTLEEMVEHGRMPWRINTAAKASSRLSLATL
jgi:glucose-1-phosphate cytidylyltransferase